MAEKDAAPPRLPLNASMTLIVQARVVEARVEARLADLGLSLRRMGLLGHLRATPGISFSELARRAGIKVQSLQPLVRGLIDSGHVTTVGGVGQGRAAVVHLTDRGGEVLDRAAEALVELDEEIFAEGPQKELGTALLHVAEAFRSGAGRAAATPPSRS